jgi:hypothetical protein
MLTRIQKEYLQKYYVHKEKFKDVSERRKFAKALSRINSDIETSFENMLWLSETIPDILLDEENEIDNPELEPHRRLKILLKVLNNINPRFEVTLMIKDSYTRKK